MSMEKTVITESELNVQQQSDDVFRTRRSDSTGLLHQFTHR
jgi:hypothetical protein